MKITTVSYQKTYPTGQYANEKIGMEATIDEDKESCIEALNQLRHYCDGIHRQNNPHLHQEQTNYVPDTNVGNISQQPEPQPIITKKLSQQELLVQQIEDATTLKALKWLEKPSQKYPETKELYDLKYSQLEAITITTTQFKKQ